MGLSENSRFDSPACSAMSIPLPPYSLKIRMASVKVWKTYALEIGIKEKDWDEGTNKAVDKHYGSKYNKELTDGCHAFLEKTIPNGKDRVEKVVQTLY